MASDLFAYYATKPQFRISDIQTGNGVYGVAIGDLNVDGKLDVISANTSDRTVTLLLGRGDGTFYRNLGSDVVGVGGGPSYVACDDLNADGKPDIVTTNWVDTSISILLGNGDGTLGSPLLTKSLTNTDYVAIADLNGDGRKDLAIANRHDQSKNIYVMLGSIAGGFWALCLIRPRELPQTESRSRISMGIAFPIW